MRACVHHARVLVRWNEDDTSYSHCEATTAVPTTTERSRSLSLLSRCVHGMKGEGTTYGWMEAISSSRWWGRPGSLKKSMHCTRTSSFSETIARVRVDSVFGFLALPDRDGPGPYHTYAKLVLRVDPNHYCACPPCSNNELSSVACMLGLRSFVGVVGRSSSLLIFMSFK
jgi:hypothetical protein